METLALAVVGLLGTLIALMGKILHSQRRENRRLHGKLLRMAQQGHLTEGDLDELEGDTQGIE